MTKYIRVIEKIDDKDKKVVLRFNKCNDCPLMKFDKNSLVIHCHKFIFGGSKIITDFVEINTNGKVADVSIPIWCGLPKDIYDLNLYKETYMKRGNSILTSLDNKERNLPIYDVSFFNRNKDIKNFNNNTPFTILNNNIDDDDIDDDDIDDDNPFNMEYDRIIHRGEVINRSTTKKREIEEEEEEDNFDSCRPMTLPTPPVQLCSFCGMPNSGVNRSVNNGMCDICYNTFKDDKLSLSQSYISNFRLKRGRTYTEESFKIITL